MCLGHELLPPSRTFLWPFGGILTRKQDLRTQPFQARTPHAIVHLDRSKHSDVIVIDGTDSEQSVFKIVPPISPPDTTEPPGNHSAPLSQSPMVKIPNDSSPDPNDPSNPTMQH
ncbi:hypothetical protein V6N13_107827 [Hibiscus sabdariffa]|uniref:Uncharacterized protein n=1 Tax=Hibiscus sabdariffa TaxID=183260 RepID=A0ABR2SQI2_9ROSI